MRGKSKLFIVLALVVLLVSSIPVAAIASDADSQPLADVSGEIAYDSLDQAQQTAYKRFQTGIENIEKTGDFAPINMFDFGVHAKDLQVVQFAYMSDHPDKFWASYYIGLIPQENTGLYLGLTATYTISLDKLTSMMKDLNNAVSSIAKSSGSMGDRMKYLHDTVNNTTSYSEDTTTYPNCGNAYGVFVDHKSKCDGYSLALALLCHRESLPCVVEIGYITSEGKDKGGHAWNIVQMDDNKWYYIDATWDDGNYDRRYEYFLIGSQTSTYTGSFASTRTIYYDYYIDVSKDKNGYEPYGFLEKNKAVIAVIVVIVIIVIFFVVYFLHKKNQQKKLQEAAANMIASGDMCPQCGCRIPKDQDFCPACGKKAFEKEDEKRPPQQ